MQSLPGPVASLSKQLTSFVRINSSAGVGWFGRGFDFYPFQIFWKISAAIVIWSNNILLPFRFIILWGYSSIPLASYDPLICLLLVGGTEYYSNCRI